MWRLWRRQKESERARIKWWMTEQNFLFHVWNDVWVNFVLLLNTLNSLIEEIDVLPCCFLLCQKLSDYTKVFVFLSNSYFFTRFPVTKFLIIQYRRHIDGLLPPQKFGVTRTVCGALLDVLECLFSCVTVCMFYVTTCFGVRSHYDGENIFMRKLKQKIVSGNWHITIITVWTTIFVSSNDFFPAHVRGRQKTAGMRGLMTHLGYPDIDLKSGHTS